MESPTLSSEFVSAASDLLAAAQQAHISLTTYNRVMNETQADAGRMNRAIDIINRGKIRKLPSGLYECIPSKSGETPYKVNLASKTCFCKDAERGHVCKHICAALMLQATPEKLPFATLNDYLDYLIAKKHTLEAAPCAGD